MSDASYVLIHLDRSAAKGAASANIADIKRALEEGDASAKSDALKQAVLSTLNGASMPQLVVPIIRYVMPSKDHVLKKLFLLYLEVLDKSGSEMLLVCNALRKDLNHPNEYVRGVVLRFLCKLKDQELLEPLVPSIRANLDHRYSYVRRNAVLTIYSIFKACPDLMPDAPDLIGSFLEKENDASCRRNAFIFLFNCAQDKAIHYLGSVADQVHSYGDTLQMIFLELARKICRNAPAERSRYIRVIYELLQSASAAVRFESALSLLSISSAAPAVRAAGQTLIELLIKESDNNIKLIVLERLAVVKKSNAKVLSELVMDILRVLHGNPSLEICRQTLALCLDLVTHANIEEVMQVLKKGIVRTLTKDADKASEHRQLLVRAVHTCSLQYPHVAVSAAMILLDYVGDANKAAAIDVIGFVREVMASYPDCRSEVLLSLCQRLPEIGSSRVLRATLWLMGEYSDTRALIDASHAAIMREVGGPLLPEEKDDADADIPAEAPDAAAPRGPTNASNVLLPDGSYASQSGLAAASSTAAATATKDPFLRRMLLRGDLYLASVLAAALTKMVLRSAALRAGDDSAAAQNHFAGSVLLLLATTLRAAEHAAGASGVGDPDSYARVVTCIHTITQPELSAAAETTFLSACRQSFHVLLEEKQSTARAASKMQAKPAPVPVDALLAIRQLVPKRTQGALTGDQMDLDEMDIGRAIGAAEKKDPVDFVSKMKRLRQLTGLSDPIYVEAFVHVHQFDIVLDVLLVNRTSLTLEHIGMNIATQGDLKLVERPQIASMAPGESRTVRANIKVSSTENGVIFGSVVYDVAGTATDESNCVVLDEIHIDIMDYIKPASCSESEFRRMWASFEWENKVPVNTTIEDVGEYLQHILRVTNMECLTMPEGDCEFLSANLYARSIFGEDALANLSVEQHHGSHVTGFVRIRSKTQGIALSLGDKITVSATAEK